MRVTEVVVGLMLGGVLGFAVHAWIVSGAEASPDRQDVRATSPTHEGAAPLSIAPSARASEPLAATPLGGSDAATGEHFGGAAADALVGILVHGAMLDTAGKPLPSLSNGSRWLTFDDGRGKSNSVEVGPGSTYAVAGLKPGQLGVSTDQAGYRPFHTTLTLAAERPVVRLDIVLEPAVVLLIKGFTPAGEPLVDALVRDLAGGNARQAPRLTAIATREAPTGDLPPISHRAYDRWGIGSYSDRLDSSWNRTDDLPLDVMGRLELDESLPAFVSLVLRHVLVATQHVEPGTKEVVFTVPIDSLKALLGSVRLRVVDAETRAVPEQLRASLTDSQSGGRGDTPDENGMFAWDQQRPGLLELSIEAPGYETWDQEVSVPAGGTANLGTIELTPATTLAGVVVDAAGKPVSVSLRALRDDLDVGLGMGERRNAKSNVEGAFSIGRLGRHRYRVVVGGEEWTALPVFVDTRQGDVSGVRVVVEPGAMLRLHTLWSAGESYGLRVSSQDGAVISSSRSWRGDWTWTERLPAGSYSVTLLRDGQELKRVPVTLKSEDVAVDVGP